MFIVFKKFALELVAGISVNYNKNTRHRRSTCQKAVLRFKIGLGDIIHNAICLILMEQYHKSAVVQTSAVFWTP